MAGVTTSSTDIPDISQTLESNRSFKETVINIAKEFIILRNNFVSELPDLSLDNQQTDKTTDRFENFNEQLIEQYTTKKNSALTIFGANSSGKTAFIQHFLQIGEILPSDVGPVTARIVKLTYSPANRAYAHIFSSLEDRLTEKEPVITIKLNEFFLDAQPPLWECISAILKGHLERSDNCDEKVFAEWATHFIEIGLPSPILELGIDMYDTPGFLSNNRDEILNTNLHELIKSIQPTLLFLYENAAVSETDKSCFLALKQALGTLDNISVFFLNTKADVVGIFKNERINVKKDVPIDKFEEVLYQTRQKRYKLLLEHNVIANEVIGGLPESIEECDCFDICTVPKALTPYRPYADLMNERTFRRIIQFAVRSDGNLYQLFADRILSSIDEYFDLVLSTTYHTEGQWAELRDEASRWAERFFEKIKSALPSILNTIQESILKLFDEQMESIAIRAGCLSRDDDRLVNKLPPSSKKVRDFVKIAVYEEVMKVAASEAMNASLANIDKILNDEILNNKKKNELLSMARRHIRFWEISGEDLNRKKFFAVILEHLVKVPTRIGQFFTILRTRPYIDWHNERSTEYELLETLDVYAKLLNEPKRREYAREYLIKMRQSIIEQKPLFETNLSDWIEAKQVQFISRIDQGYKYAIDNMERWKKANNLTEKYSELFAVFECQLIAAKDLAKFNGIKPTVIEDEPLGSGGFFNVHAAQWADKLNLAVKIQRNETINDHPYMAYMEAHYHRAITNARQTNVVPLLYLYYNKNELYIFMPKYKQSLQNYIQENATTIKIDKILGFALIIANILNDIHRNDLVHRDIKSSNILLDENERCYLSDFGTVKQGTANQTVVGTMPLPPEMVLGVLLRQYNISTIYDGKMADIFAYGVLLYELLPKEEYYRPNVDSAYSIEKLLANDKLCPLPVEMKDYLQLIVNCLETKFTDRPNASTIVARIEQLITSNEIKVCAICSIRERTVRTRPCGHKVLCQQCRDNLRSRNQNLCVLCKRPMLTDVQDNSNKTIYLK